MNKKIPAILFYLIAASVLLCGCKARETGKQEVSGSFRNVWEITEVLDDKKYNDYMNDDGTLFRKLLGFKNRLTNSPEYEFYAYANNLIELIGMKIPETCVENHDTDFASESVYVFEGQSITAAQAIQISENFFNLFPVEITEGRCFEASDFDYSDTDMIPVILGGDYRGLFSPGDIFEGYYICERRTFKVIGFSDADHTFYLKNCNRLEPYSGYIIMPFERVRTDSQYERAILLQEICGYIMTDKGTDRSVQLIQDYLKDSGIDEWVELIIVNKKSLQEKMNLSYQ